MPNNSILWLAGKVLVAGLNAYELNHQSDQARANFLYVFAQNVVDNVVDLHKM